MAHGRAVHGPFGPARGVGPLLDSASNLHKPYAS
jgi:hypothetical protein